MADNHEWTQMFSFFTFSLQIWLKTWTPYNASNPDA